MKRYILALIVFSSVPAAYSSEFSLEKLAASDIRVIVETAALEIVPPLPPKPAAAAPADAQLIQKFDLVRNQLRGLKSGGDNALYEMRRLETEALRIGASGAQHLSFQRDMLRLSTEMSRRVQETRNAYYAVVNLQPSARKDRELYLRAEEMDKAALSLSALENGARRLESVVASVSPASIGYTALARAREISSQAGQVGDQGRELRAQTFELAKKTRP